MTLAIICKDEFEIFKDHEFYYPYYEAGDTLHDGIVFITTDNFKNEREVKSINKIIKFLDENHDIIYMPLIIISLTKGKSSIMFNRNLIYKHITNESSLERINRTEIYYLTFDNYNNWELIENSLFSKTQDKLYKLINKVEITKNVIKRMYQFYMGDDSIIQHFENRVAMTNNFKLMKKLTKYTEPSCMACAMYRYMMDEMFRTNDIKLVLTCDNYLQIITWMVENSSFSSKDNVPSCVTMATGFLLWKLKETNDIDDFIENLLNTVCPAIKKLLLSDKEYCLKKVVKYINKLPGKDAFSLLSTG